MNRASRIAIAAALAASLGYSTPTLAVEISARGFVEDLALNFAAGDLAIIRAKLDQLSEQQFEGIMVGDREMISLNRMLSLLGQVQSGAESGDSVAAAFQELLAGPWVFRFIFGDQRLQTVNLDGSEPEPQFPAGSAG